MSKKYTTNFLEDTNGSTGSANQVLVSTAAGIDWVDGSGSGIIGGPYLPLAGGTLTGNTNLTGSTKKLILNSGAQLGFEDATPTGTIYLYNDGAATSRLNIGGTMWVEEGGNVGIGTTSPSANLEVKGDGDIIRATRGTFTVTTSMTSGSHNILSYGKGFNVGTSDANSLGFSTSNSTRLLITSAGNVGIGTTSPDSKLDVTGGNITINTLGTTFADFKYGAVGSEVSRGSITTDGIDLKVNATADLLLLPTGNVGIGTTNPGAKLEVSGDLRISSSTTDLMKISNESGEDYFSVFQSTNNKPTLSLGDIDEQYGTLLTVDVENEEVVIFTNGQIYIGDNGFGNSTKFIVDDVNEKFTFTNGDVGIGTTSPSQKLEVDGNVKAETLIATDLNDGYVPYSKSGTLGLQDSKIYTNGAGIGVGTTTLAAGCHITSLSDISATGYRVSAMQTAPSSRGDTGTLGEIRITADYIYVCYATDSWKRVAIAQW